MRLKLDVFSQKAPAEVIPVTFDFKNLLTSIDSATVSVSVKHGTDSNPAAMLYSSAQITGTQVRQLIQGGIDGVVYLIRVDAVKGSERYASAIFLPVVELL